MVPLKHFAFMRMETRADAERAKRELDGREQSGRPMRVRFAPHQGAVKVTNLGPWVSNELVSRVEIRPLLHKLQLMWVAILVVNPCWGGFDMFTILLRQ